MRKWWKEALRRKARPHAARSRTQRRVLSFESLEERQLLTTTLTAIQPSFVQEGPAPITNQNATTTNGLVKASTGAVQAIAVNTAVDSSGNDVYIGTVNGGIWQTTNYYSTGSGPTWTAITDQDNINIPSISGSNGALTADPTKTTPSSGLNGSLSISALAIDKSTSLPGSLPQGSALVAATGHYSDVGLNGTGPAGGPLTGVWEMLPNNGNSLALGNPNTWYQVEGIPTGQNYAAVAVGSDSSSGTLTQYIMAANNGGSQYDNPRLVRSEPTGGLYEVTMTYANGVPTYTPFTATTPLPAGAVTDVIQDPSTPTTFYAAVIGTNAGIFRTTDDGKDWLRIADVSTMPELNNAVNVELAPAKNLTLYVGIVGSDFQLDNVYYSTNDNANLPSTQAINEGVTWTSMGTPSTADGGINYYLLGAINFAITVDPNNSSQIYVGGDFSPPSAKTGTWPNSLGQAEDTGVVFRGNVVSKTSSTWTPLVGVDGQNTSPPAGTRQLLVGPTGELLEANNGGIYDRTSPTGAGSWVSHDGLVPSTPTQVTNALSTNEFTSVAYNPLANSIIGGTQDEGIVEQGAQNGSQWSTVSVNLAGESVNPNQTFNVPVSPVGISGGQVAIDTNTPGQAILYASNDYFSDFFEQTLSSQMTVPPAPASPGPTMYVNGAGSETLYQIENNAGASFPAQTPIAVNNVLANALVVGSNFVYESTTANATTLGGNGNYWTAIQGLATSGGTPTPINGIGPVTALAYGGTLNGAPNPYILWAGSSGGYELYLRAPSQASPTGQTFTTGGTATYQNPNGVLLPQTGYSGGTPVGIVMNPSNWTHTYVASGSTVTLATVTPWTGSNPNVTTSTTAFKSLGGPSGLSISGIVYIPLPASVNATDDAIVVSGWASGNSSSTGVYELLVNKTTGLADGNWTMVGVAANGVQTGVAGQKPQLPHVPVTAITYNSTADVLVVATEGRGVWELQNFTKLANSYAMAVTGSGTVSFQGVANDPGYFDVLVNGINDTIVAGPNTTLPANLKQYPLPLSAIQDAVTVTLTGSVNSFDINYTNGTPIPTIPNNPTPGFTVTGSGTTSLTVEDDAPSLTLSTTVAGSTLAMSNSSTVIGLTGITSATLTGGSGNNNFIINGWTVPTTLTGVSGTDTLTDTSTSTSNIASVLTNTSLVQTVIGGAALDTVNFSNITTANLTGGTGTSNTFDITNWTAGGGSINGGSAGGTGNTIIDTTTVDSSYIFFNNAGISVGSPSNWTLYRPLIALANLQTITLTGVNENHFFDTGWLGTVNITGSGTGNAVQVGTLQSNTTFTLSNSQIVVGTTSIVNMINEQYVQLMGGAGANTYIVSNFHLIGYVGGAGTSNTIVAAEPQDFDVTNSQILVGTNGNQGTFYISDMSALNINTVSGAHNVYIDSFSGTGTLSAGTGQDNFRLGGTGSTSSLDGLGAFHVAGGGGSTLTLNDVNGNGVSKYWYDLFNESVVPDEDTPRAWGGVSYDQWIYTVTINGTSASGGAEYLLAPSNTNSIVIYGNSPNDFLGVLFYGTQAQNLTSTPTHANPAKSNGYWTFNNPGQTQVQMPVSFAGINSFNNVTPLVLTGASGSGNTSSPLVRVYNATTGDFQDQFYAYDQSFQGGVQTAVGQFQPNNPNSYFIVTAPGPGTPDLVKVWTTTGTLVTSFYAFGPNYTGGVNIAVGDITGDGIPDIIVGAQSGNTIVRVFDASQLGSATPSVNPGRMFYAYPVSYTGGVSVAAGSFNGGKYDDIITVPYTAGPALVEIFDAQAYLNDQTVPVMDSYYALPPSYTLGATLAVGNVNADGVPDIAVGAGVDGNSEIVVTDGASVLTGTSTPTTLNTFYAYPDAMNSLPPYSPSVEVPVRIGMKDILGDGRMEIFTAQAAGGDAAGGMNVLMVSYPGLYLAHLSINSAATGGLTIG